MRVLTQADGGRGDGRIVRGSDLPIYDITPGAGGLHSYVLWKRFPITRNAKKADVWRVEGHLGLDPIGEPGSAAPLRTGLNQRSLLILDDAALGFRGDEEAWPRTAIPVDAPVQDIGAAERPRSTAA